uniref:ubiquitinyl hydrolase 1 n=1 Tax=Ditylenchus dipsaci TaxID=166011 RepID=A0A915DPB0_9BILA
MILKCQLFDLTGVAPERQKIINKGNLLKDDDWGNVTLEEGLVCMMLGASSVSTEGQSSNSNSNSLTLKPQGQTQTQSKLKLKQKFELEF